jgi:hypothetical protein
MQQVVRKLAPADFPHEAVRRGLHGRAIGNGEADRRQALARTDLAEVQVGREPRGLGEVGAIATFPIAAECILGESLDAGQRTGLARAPGLVEPRVPADARQQPESFERQAGRRRCR